MLLVAGVALGSLVSSAQSEAVLSNTASEAAYSPTFPVAFPAVAGAIREGRVVVLDTMLTEEELRAAREDVDALLIQGGGAFAANANQDTSVRRDSVVWITGQEAGVGPGLKHAVALLRGLAHEFAATPAYDKSVLWVQSAAQLACYAGDSQAHYAPHLDASTDSVWTLGLSAWLRARAYRERTITAILYLNDKEWDEDAVGGCLRCHVPSSLSSEAGHGAIASGGGGSALCEKKQHARSRDGDVIAAAPAAAVEAATAAAIPAGASAGDEATAGAASATAIPPAAVAVAAATTNINNVSTPMPTTQQDVAPRGGRLVLFDSAAILHEVLPSHNKGGQRVALTVWVSDRRDR